MLNVGCDSSDSYLDSEYDFDGQEDKVAGKVKSLSFTQSALHQHYLSQARNVKS